MRLLYLYALIENYFNGLAIGFNCNNKSLTPSHYHLTNPIQLFQGLPSCPSFGELRSRLPELGCWSLPHVNEKGDIEEATGNNNNHPNTNGNHTATPLHKFYKQQRKMPGFRGRRGLCGCFQVSWYWYLIFTSRRRNVVMLRWDNNGYSLWDSYIKETKSLHFFWLERRLWILKSFP